MKEENFNRDIACVISCYRITLRLEETVEEVTETNGDERRHECKKMKINFVVHHVSIVKIEFLRRIAAHNNNHNN